MEEKEIEKTQEQLDNEYQYDNGFHPKEVVLKPNYVFYPRNIFYAILRRFTVLLSKFHLKCAIINEHYIKEWDDIITSVTKEFRRSLSSRSWRNTEGGS